jgi:hypothetical protein
MIRSIFDVEREFNSEERKDSKKNIFANKSRFSSNFDVRVLDDADFDLDLNDLDCDEYRPIIFAEMKVKAEKDIVKNMNSLSCKRATESVAVHKMIEIYNPVGNVRGGKT